jgi:histidyl-tRNA synthetase
MEIQTITGFKDVLPGESWLFERIFASAREVFGRYGYSEIILPVMEKTELFARGIGGGTDIVEKEMYSFKDRDGESVTLRPEGTASVVRSLVENHLMEAGRHLKLHYAGPMFRHERPQKGRLRQFNQVGAELFGASEPAADAECIQMLMEFLDFVGLKNARLELNSIGCPECRPGYVAKLKEFLEANKLSFCKDCVGRIDRNPLRSFDCKEEGCRKIMAGAPLITGSLCAGCEEHFSSVKKHLDATAVNYVLNPKIVRGLDYYSRTTFEVVAEGLGSQNAVAAGGRYDRLVKELGGEDVPGIGFAVGVERLVIILKEELKEPAGGGVFVATLGEAARMAGFKIASDIRKAGIRAELDYGAKSLKSQMRLADRLGARLAVIIGDNELVKGAAVVRDMASKEQAEVAMPELASYIKARLA